MPTVYTHSATGLGNRFKMLLTAHRLAALSQRRVEFYWPLTRECNAPFARLCLPHHNCHVLGGRRTGQVAPVELRGAALLPFCRESSAERIVIDWCNRDSSFADVDQYLRLAPEPQELVTTFLREHFQQPVVGVHYRGTDIPETPPLPVFAKAIACLPADTLLFLSTDEPGRLAWFREQYGDRVLHYPCRTRNRNKGDGIVDALVDMFLLRACRGVIGSRNSSFFLCASWDNGYCDLHRARLSKFHWDGVFATRRN